jgi:hypothetical protein
MTSSASVLVTYGRIFNSIPLDHYLLKNSYNKLNRKKSKEEFEQRALRANDDEPTSLKPLSSLCAKTLCVVLTILEW